MVVRTAATMIYLQLMVEWCAEILMNMCVVVPEKNGMSVFPSICFSVLFELMLCEQ